MRYLFDPKSGMLKGRFTCDWDYDLDGEDDHIQFTYSDSGEPPVLSIDGEQFYVKVANLVRTTPNALLDNDWVGVQDFRGFRTDNFEDAYDDWEVLDIAKKTGPLFGSYDEAAGLMSTDEIREPLLGWFEAVRSLAFAIKAQAWLTGRGEGEWLDDELYFIHHVGKEQEWWECVRYSFRELSGPYSAMLKMDDVSSKRLLLPAREERIPGHFFSVGWDATSEPCGGRPRLSVSMIPEGFNSQSIPSAYVSFRYMRKHQELEPAARAMIAHLVRALVLLHTHNIYLDLHDSYFGTAYNNLLEHLWCSFALDGARGKLGICKQCGHVFEATNERKDRKVYCSTYCQENAKSARQYRRNKIRKAIEEECSYDVLYLLHVLDDYSITREMVEEVVAESSRSGKE
jgi:hypothetical protein